MDFQTKIIELRKQKGWSQEQLEDMIGVTRQTISKWELGTSVPDLNMLVKISQTFPVSLDELTGNEEVKESVNYGYVIRPAYEYKSKKQLFGLPLVHINIGRGFRKAKGIIGNKTPHLYKSPHNTDTHLDNMEIPCSVYTYGIYLRPP